MGIVRRQGAFGAVFVIVGVLVGYLNKTYLFTKYLDPETFGFIEVLLTLMVIISWVALLGINTAIPRFLPMLHAKDRYFRSFSFFSILVPVSFSLVICLALYLTKSWWIGLLDDSSNILNDQFLKLLILSVFWVIIELASAFLNSFLRNLSTVAVKEIGMRLYQTAIILLHGFGHLSLDGFLALFIAGYGLVALLLCLLLKSDKRFAISFTMQAWKGRFFRKVMSFSMSVYLTNLLYLLLQRMDILLLAYFAQYNDVGTYSIALYFCMFIQIPGRTLYTIIMPIISRNLRKNDLASTGKLYAQTALHSSLAGLVIYSVVFNCIDPIFSFIDAGYHEGKYIVLLLSWAKLIEISTGPGGIVLQMSKKNGRLLVINITMVLLFVILGALLIPIYGLWGTVISVLITSLGYNFWILLEVWRFFRLQPFSRAYLYLPFIAGIAIVSGWLIPDFGPALMLLVVKATVTACVFGALTLALGVSDEITKVKNTILRRMGLRRH